MISPSDRNCRVACNAASLRRRLARAKPLAHPAEDDACAHRRPTRLARRSSPGWSRSSAGRKSMLAPARSRIARNASYSSVARASRGAALKFSDSHCAAQIVVAEKRLARMLDRARASRRPFRQSVLPAHAASACSSRVTDMTTSPRWFRTSNSVRTSPRSGFDARWPRLERSSRAPTACRPGARVASSSVRQRRGDARLATCDR